MLHEQTEDKVPVYGVKPEKPGMHLGLFHGRKKVNEVMQDWGFDGPCLGPLNYFHTTYASTIQIEFENPVDAHRFTGSYTLQCELQLNGDMLRYEGNYFGDWTVYMVKPEECFRQPDTFRLNNRTNEMRKQAQLKEPLRED
jgi:hypothetical protein